MTFPVVGVGQSSAALPVTISNSSNYAIGSLSLAINAPFALTQNNCTASLAAGASCSAAIVFQPVASGTGTGALTVSSSSGFSGHGGLWEWAFIFRWRSPARAAFRWPQARPQLFGHDRSCSGARGATYTCGTLPANALCLFNPATTTVSAGATGSVMVQISTGKSGSARMESPAGWRMLPMVCGYCCCRWRLVDAGRRSSKRSSWSCWRRFSAGISSCNSSGVSIKGAASGGGSANSHWNLPDSCHFFVDRYLGRGNRNFDSGLREEAENSASNLETGNGLYSIFGLSERAAKTEFAGKPGPGCQRLEDVRLGKTKE